MNLRSVQRCVSLNLVVASVKQSVVLPERKTISVFQFKNR